MSILHALRQDQSHVDRDNAIDLRERAKRCREAADRVRHKYARIADLLLATSRAYDQEAAQLEAKVGTARVIQ